jgi:Tol biopolymer transport system component
MKSTRILAALLFVSAPLLAQTTTPLEKRIETDISTLASPQMEGRGLGTKGIGLAADYIEQRLRAMHLEPVFGSGYRQPFPVKTGVSAGANNRLEGVASDAWSPLGFSSPGAFSGDLVFVGYGIDAPPIGYREYEGIDLKGKVALMLRYEPQEKDDASPFDGRKPSRWSAMRYKVLQARERGAAAVIFVTGPIQDEGQDKVPALKNDGPESPAGIPVLQVKASVAQAWLHPAGIDLAQFQKMVDRDLRPRSRSTNLKISGNVDVKPEYVDTENLAGRLPGRGRLASKIVVLGAHYDHLGYGGQGSTRPNVHEIHPGADDNASGTSGVMNAAEQIAKDLENATDRRTIVFALFSGEESGLAGSGYLVDHPPFPMDHVVAMVNLDMIGAMREDKLIAYGVDSAPEWRSLLDKIIPATNLKVTETGDGYGPSDQTSFYAMKVPVLHFFTGAHDRYHSPDDKAEFINYPGEARVIGLVTSVVDALAITDAVPHYARSSAAPAMEGDSRGYGAYLGTVPDFSAMDQTTGGVLLADVRPGAPADKAGLKAKDRIVEIGGTRIANLYDMTYALQDHKPGDTVDVIVMRNNERTKLRATLGARGGTPAPKMPEQKPAAPAQAVPAAKPEAAMPPQAAAKPAMPQAAASDSKIASWYDGRPGKDFVIKAGKPFEKTFDGEKHLKDIRQLTFGGENAEAYWSPDGTKLIFQAPPAMGGCDQQYTMDLTTGETKMVSSGKGRTTCGYYRWPQGDKIIYASTEAASPDCPPRPSHAEGYLWPVYRTFDIFEADPDGANAKRITTEPGYDAEMTWCHRGGKMVFTSTRDGDLDLYEMDEAGNVKRLTNTPGYDGGAFYNADCTEIVWRANHPTGAALDEYKGLLARDLVKPLHMELWVMNADGSNQRQITNNGAANFCPYFTPDGKRIIFASNVQSEGFNFDLWMANKDGSGLERLTTAPGFDGFPVFSPDGTFVTWSSSRAKPDSHEMNLFVARWVE